MPSGLLRVPAKGVRAARRSHEVSALTTLLFIAVPMVQIVFGVFPLAPNRWFGVGFAAYYYIATPLMYKARHNA